MLMYNYEIITSTEEEKKILNDLHTDFSQHIEMADYEYNFLNSLILRKKPKKILELGVSEGGSSALILNAIKDFDDSFLYSIDYRENNYRFQDKKNGYYMNEYPKLKKKWKLFLGGLALNFLDEIGDGIDFCLIDTRHSNPGEILDFLMVFPYLKENATVVFHDIKLQYLNLKYKTDLSHLQNQFTNNMLISTINGKKVIPFLIQEEEPKFSNIGGIELNTQLIKSDCWDIFNLLTVRWEYILLKSERLALSLHYKRWYGEELSLFFDAIANEMTMLFKKAQMDKLKNVRNRSELD